MAYPPKPITVTTQTVAAYGAARPEPQPYVIVGTGSLVVKQAAIANQAAATLPADFAGVQTQLASLTTKINAILAAIRAAGVILP